MRRSWYIAIAAIPALFISATGAAAQAAVEYGNLAGNKAVPAAKMPQPKIPQLPSPQAAPPQTAPPQQERPSSAQNPAGSQTPQEPSVPLRLLTGKSLLVKTADRTRRVSVSDPTVANALVVTPNQILIEGRSPGEVSLIIWNEYEESRSFDVRVEVDTTAVADELKRDFPTEPIRLSSSQSALMISGHVTSKDVADRAGALAGAYTKNVVNLLTYGAAGADEILLEVKFAEVDRTALSQYGFNLFSTGAANTFAGSSTQQFGGLTASAGATTSDVTKPTATGTNVFTSEIKNQLFHQPAAVGSNNLLNFFLFRTDINLGAVIQDLQEKNILQILAEPNLIAVDGKESNFLAGGEFPYPVPQGITGSITIQFKEFGVRLAFVPLIKPDGIIHLQVKPEVSSLDFSNALTTNGFVIPALSTRRAETEFELKDGQSFVIAGLMDNRVTDILNKIPGLADIPILGTFFKSRSTQKTKTELMVLVTAHKINPLETPTPLPSFPKPFLKDKQMDDPAGKHTEKPSGTPGK